MFAIPFADSHTSHNTEKKKMTFVSDETPFSLCNVKMHINFEISWETPDGISL